MTGAVLKSCFHWACYYSEVGFCLRVLFLLSHFNHLWDWMISRIRFILLTICICLLLPKCPYFVYFRDTGFGSPRLFNCLISLEPANAFWKHKLAWIDWQSCRCSTLPLKTINLPSWVIDEHEAKFNPQAPSHAVASFRLWLVPGKYEGMRKMIFSCLVYHEKCKRKPNMMKISYKFIHFQII